MIYNLLSAELSKSTSQFVSATANQAIAFADVCKCRPPLVPATAINASKELPTKKMDVDRCFFSQKLFHKLY